MRTILVILGLLLTLSVPAFAQDKIGPAFPSELKAAGLFGLPFSWNSHDGTFDFGPSMTQAQKRAVLNVYQAHDPATPAPKSQEQLDRDELKAKCDAVLTDLTITSKIRDVCSVLKKVIK